MVDGCKWDGFSLSIKWSHASVTGYLLSISAPAGKPSALRYPLGDVDHEDALTKIFWDVVDLCASNPENIWIPSAWEDAWRNTIFGVSFAADVDAIVGAPAPRIFYAQNCVLRRQTYMKTNLLLHHSVTVSWTPIAQNQSLRQRVQYAVNAFAYPKHMSARGNMARLLDQ